MNANDIREHFISRSPWIDPKGTVDTIKAGDPTKEIKTVAVSWFPSLETLKEAHRLGADLFITHEPTFWEHAAPELHWRKRGPGIEKQKFLDETGMVVLRIHDVWDKWPEIGIRGAWAKGLGLTNCVAVDETQFRGVYAIEPQPLKQFAKYVAGKVKCLGQDSVQAMGDPDQIVKRPAIGVGCIGPDMETIEKGADCIIVCYDGANYWSHRERFHAMGLPVISVEHGTTEMWGLESLAQYLRDTFPELTVHYVDKHPKPWTVVA